jgi:hypothetical protein
MRRIAVVLVSVLAVLGMLAPPVLAQQPAAAPPPPPAPKVTITGFVDFVTSIYGNIQDNIITNDDDDGWYSRERGVFTLTGEIGKSKAVWAVELDFTNGQGATSNGTSANFDLDTDVAGFVETKWLYLETPITGPGSLMPFIPVATIGRFGAQPAAGHAYKPGILWSGDFPGMNLVTTWAPNVRSTLTWAQIGEALNERTAVSEDWAILASVEWDIFKGLTVKPTYAYASYDGGNTGTANLGTEQKGGFSTNAAANAPGLDTKRHYIGGDLRWTTGPFSLQPTFLYSWGTQGVIPGGAAVPAGAKREVDINTWIFDVIGGFRTGPLNLEGRFAYTPGNEASECVQQIGVAGATCQGGDDVKYFQAINPGFVYQAGWAEIQASGVDYNLVLQSGGPGVAGGPGGNFRLGQNPSYDKYGRITVALAADYSLTPALTFHAVTNIQWTAEKVDTNGALGAAGLTPASVGGARASGDDSYLGTELDLGFTYRFAPNVAFDLIGAYLWAGEARGLSGLDPEDVYKISARMRVSF